MHLPDLSSCVTSNVNSRGSSLPDRSTSDLDNNASASSSVVFKPRAFKAARSSCVSMSELRSLSYLSKTALTRSGMFVGDAAVVAFDAGVHSCLGAPAQNSLVAQLLYQQSKLEKVESSCAACVEPLGICDASTVLAFRPRIACSAWCSSVTSMSAGGGSRTCRR